MVATSPQSIGRRFRPDEPEGLRTEMETSLHASQLALLVECLKRLWEARQDFFLGDGITVRYIDKDTGEKKTIGPDFFVIQGVPRIAHRSWVVWEEGDRCPEIVIELLSRKTANKDRDPKKDIYEKQLQTRDYFWFAPDDVPKAKQGELAGFRLVSGRYEPMQPDASDRLWSEELGLYLGVWYGNYGGDTSYWLRFYFPDGTLVPSREEGERAEREAKERERQEKERERQAKERERQEKERERQLREQAEARAARAEIENEALRQRLRELGIDPNEL